jgi:hypothetical protein
MKWLFIFIPIAVALEHTRPEQHTWIFFAARVADPNPAPRAT